MSDQPLRDKVVLLTGGSSGLGRAFALALGKAGAKLFLAARREEKLREVVDEIAAAGGEAAYHVCDVRVVPSLYDLVDVALARYRRLDVLINNAGLGFRAPLLNLPDLGQTTFGQSRLPAVTPYWESASLPGMFFAGTLSQAAGGLKKHGLPANSGAVPDRFGFRSSARLA